MEFVPVKVGSYAGSKADENPLYFVWEDITFTVLDIEDRWYEGYKDKNDELHYFKVKTDLTGTYLLRHELRYNRWFLVFK